ncbi:ABC transporter permease [Anthocerotibacter panamensis]|uniref:ABC transporter permease n=1 Tax=Anthocerotibacter panamensis TaxID=2857077 RepID=UPI001C405AF7|nr:ABC transporter permease [Anthocerotibacter panamensis]
MNPGRVLAIASNAFRETIRDRVLLLVGFFVVLLAIGNYLLPNLAATEGYKIVLDASLGAIHLFSLVIAVFVGTSLIRKEVEKRTIFTLVSKPLSRAEFLLGKHLGLGAVLGVLLGLMTACFLILYLGTFKGLDLSLPGLLTAICFSYVELLLIVAAALFFGSFTSSVLATLFTFSLYLAGHFSQSLLQLGALSKNEFVQNLTRVAYVILPDLERFNLREGAAFGLLPAPWEMAGTLVYGFFYIAFLLSAAHLLFARREF